MARERRTIYVCDNPECAGRVMPEEDGAVAKGWHFSTVRVHTDTGGGSVRDVFACSDECVVPALWGRIRSE